MGAASVWDRGVSSGDQAVLWDREMPGAARGGATGSHSVGAAGIRAAGGPLAADRHQLVSGQDGHHSHGYSGLSRSSPLHPCRRANCVTPIVIGIHLVDKHSAVFSTVTGEIT